MDVGHNMAEIIYNNSTYQTMTATIKPNMEYRGFEITTVKYVEERHPQYNYLSFMARNGDKHINAVFRDLDMRIKSEEELLSIFKNRIDSFIEEMDIIRKKAMLTKKDLDEYTKSDPKGEGFDDQDQEINVTATSLPRDSKYEKVLEEYFAKVTTLRNIDILEAVINETLKGMAKGGYTQMRCMTELGDALFTLKEQKADE